MTDRTSEQGEALHRVPPIYTPEQFDALLAEKPEMRAQIGGFMTIGLEHFKAPHSPLATSIMPYGEENNELYCGLTKEAYTRTFDKTPDHYNEDALQRNRTVYGRSASIVELLMDRSGIDFQTFTDEGFDNLVDVFDELLKVDEQGLSIEDKEPEIHQLVLRLQDYDVDLQALQHMQTDLRKRGGMQIVFGPSDAFAAFLKRNLAEATDDYACNLSVPIPNEFILAIIAVGEYEQEQLHVA